MCFVLLEKKLRIRAVTFGDQSYEVNDEGEFDLDQPDGWEVETKLWSAKSETDYGFTDEYFVFKRLCFDPQSPEGSFFWCTFFSLH